MQLQRLRTQQWVTCDTAAKLGGGGEGVVYGIQSQPALAAKIWKQPTPARAEKLRAMLLAPPPGLQAGGGRVRVAWPLDLLTEQNQIVGFLMPRATGALPLHTVLHPKARRRQLPWFDRRYLHRTAFNLARTVDAIHARGYVIGDVNESNILVFHTAPQPGLVTLIDADSFQVIDFKGKKIHRCSVGKPEFTPPELQGKHFPDITRQGRHDVFGLAVLLFELLMEGVHPFMGVYTGGGADPSLGECIRRGYFPYSRSHVPCKPSLVAPPFEALHPALQQLFIRCFEDGHHRPDARPSSREWAKALEIAAAVLVPCGSAPPHFYSSHVSACPECARSQKMMQAPASARGQQAPVAGPGYPQVCGVIQRPRRPRKWLRRATVAAAIGTLVFFLVRPEPPGSARLQTDLTFSSQPPAAQRAPAPKPAPWHDSIVPHHPGFMRVPAPYDLTETSPASSPPAGSTAIAHESAPQPQASPERLRHMRQPAKVPPPKAKRSADVWQAQVVLKALGYDPGTIDGILGPHTARAVQQFQRASGLPATGQLDVKTMRNLADQAPSSRLCVAAGSRIVCQTVR